MTTAQVDRFNGLTGARGVKDPCRAVSTGNLTLSGEQTVNGVACVADDRVLVKDQTDPIENGVYDVKTTAWVRSADFNGPKDIAVGTTVVAQGNYYSVAAAGTIGSGAITFNAGVAPGGAADIHAATAKSPLVGADEFGFWDSVSGLLRKISYTNLLSSLGSTFAALAGVSTQVFSVAEAAAATNAPRASQLTGRNMIANGSCQVDQVNAGALVTPVSGSYPIDNVYFSAAQASKLQTQQLASFASLSDGYYSIRTTTLSQYTPGASEAFIHRFGIEGLDLASLKWGTSAASAVSLQFKAKASVSGTYSGAISNFNGSRTYPFSFFLTASTDTLVKIENIPGDTLGTWKTTNELAASVVFDLGNGSSVRGTANAWQGASALYGVTGAVQLVSQANGSYLDIGDVQLEKGAFCTQFERKPYDQVLRECQRYFIKSYSVGVTAPTNTSPGAVFSAGYAAVTNLYFFGGVRFPEPMRAAPTITIYSYTSSTSGKVSSADGVDLASSSGVASLIGDAGFGVYNNSGGNITPATGGFIFHYTANARL